MYSTCLFCHATLGENQTIEHFPIGRRLAFDAERGRLWAVCVNCARWNLTPLEERWEAIEECERAYRDTKKRVSTDNIALARLGDGTDLVRIGRPLLPEYCAWRYGDQLGQRQKRHFWRYTVGAGSLNMLHVAAMATVSVGAFTKSPIMAYSSTFALGGFVAAMAANRITDRPLAHVQIAPGQHVGMHQYEARDGRLAFTENGVLEHSFIGRVRRRFAPAFMKRMTRKQTFVLTGDAARRALSESVVAINHEGAKPDQVSSAVSLIESGTDATQMIKRVADHAWLKSDYYRGKLTYQQPESLLALEMLLHEEDERRAMAGELGELYARWEEAERTAKIADGELTELSS